MDPSTIALIGGLAVAFIALCAVLAGAVRLLRRTKETMGALEAGRKDMRRALEGMNEEVRRAQEGLEGLQRRRERA